MNNRFGPNGYKSLKNRRSINVALFHHWAGCSFHSTKELLGYTHEQSSVVARVLHWSGFASNEHTNKRVIDKYLLSIFLTKSCPNFAIGFWSFSIIDDVVTGTQKSKMLSRHLHFFFFSRSKYKLANLTLTLKRYFSVKYSSSTSVLRGPIL